MLAMESGATSRSRTRWAPLRDVTSSSRTWLRVAMRPSVTPSATASMEPSALMSSK